MILLMTTAPPIKSPWGVPGKLPPLGLAYVAAALEKGGFQVEILDNYNLKKPIEQVKQEIKRLEPEIVGNKRRILVGGEYTGPYTVKAKAKQFGIELSEEKIEKILQKTRGMLLGKKESLSDEEFLAIVKEVK